MDITTVLKCCRCQVDAKGVESDDGIVELCFCPSCDIRIRGDDYRLMQRQYRDHLARQKILQTFSPTYIPMPGQTTIHEGLEYALQAGWQFFFESKD